MPITVYRYQVRVSGRDTTALTFDPGTHATPAGEITGPEGTAVTKVGGRWMLKVPKAVTNQWDCIVLSARDAIDEARQGNLGLSFSTTITEHRDCGNLL